MSGDPLIGRVEPGAKLTPSGAGNGVTEQKAGIPGMGLEWPPEPFSSCISLKKKKNPSALGQLWSSSLGFVPEPASGR